MKLFHFLLRTICSRIFVGRKKIWYFTTPNSEDSLYNALKKMHFYELKLVFRTSWIAG